MVKSNIPEKLRVFHFHGVDINTHKSQAVGTCPFCDKDEHFYVKTTTGQWSCRVCGEGMPDKAAGTKGGNIYTFLERLLHYSKQATTDADYRELSNDRKGCPVWALKEWGVVKNYLNGDWLIPAYNNKGNLSNVFKAYKTGDGWRVISSPTCKLHPMGVNLLLANKRTETVRIQEGPWDAIAVYAALASVKRNGKRLVKLARHNKTTSMLSTTAVLCTPGSGVFQDPWFEYLKGREARLGFDNDHPKKNPKTNKVTKPGWDGMGRIHNMAGLTKYTPGSLYRVCWSANGKSKPPHVGYTKDLDNGYDYRDLVNDLGPVKALERMDAMEQPVKLSPKKSSTMNPGGDLPDDIEPIPRSSFKDLVTDFKTCLHWTPQLEDTFAVMLACMASTDLNGDQIWLRIIGPPGSGKTTLAEVCSASRKYAFPVSLQTGFHSGYGMDKEKDSSLIPQMAGKTTIIKDGDTLLTSTNRDTILAEMRDLYDRVSRARYRTGRTNIYEGVNITFIICGTDEMRSLNRSFLGERFLDCEILGDEDRTPYLDRALDNAYLEVTGSMNKDNEVRDKAKEKFLKQVTTGYIQHLREGLVQGTHTIPTMSATTGQTLKALGQLLSFVRARVNREGVDIAYRPRPELATRLVKQFTKLAVVLAVVLGKNTVDRDVIRVVRKVMLDTGESFQLEIIHQLYQMKTGGLSARQLGHVLRISEGSVRKILADMREFHIVERDSVNNRSGQRGRNRHLSVLNSDIREMYKQALGTKGKQK